MASLLVGQGDSPFPPSAIGTSLSLKNWITDHKVMYTFDSLAAGWLKDNGLGEAVPSPWHHPVEGTLDGIYRER